MSRSAAWLGLAALVGASCAAPPSAAPDPWTRLDPGAVLASNLVTLPGNTHPAAIPGNSAGKLADSYLIENMQLVLQRSPAQEAAVALAIDALHDKASPTYQKWFTVDTFADQYGTSPADVATIVRWLESYGFTIDSVPPSRMFIEFTGTAGQVNAAFHTQMHHLEVKGVDHIANMSDPQIPAELAKVVAGVHALHDFMPHSMKKERGQIKRGAATGRWSQASPRPNDTFTYGGECYQDGDCGSDTCNTATGLCACTKNNQCSPTLSGAAAKCNTTAGTCVSCQTNADCFGPDTCNVATGSCQHNIQAVTPADFATIYNLNPLFAEGITGTGQTIAVIEKTLLKSVSDVATFRTAFGLSGYGGTFTQKLATGTTTCKNPGVVATDESEAAIDAEWAGASAPGAAILLAACKDTSTTFGGLNALQNLVNGASPPSVVSISYGDCEAFNGAAANKTYSTTYQQAAALGVSVFVSAGDEGAASCDPDQVSAFHGIAVSGYASTAYNVAVGGTDFGDYYNSQHGGPPVSNYWNATNSSTFGSALSYLPEVPWNNSCASSLIYSTPSMALGTYTQAWGASGFCNSTLGSEWQTTTAGSGGPSAVWPQPSWQTGVVGLPTKSGGVRNIPDVSLFAANGAFGHLLLYCMTDTANFAGGGPCVYSSNFDSYWLGAGGTSFAAPALAGIQALVNQKMGGAQGNPNYTYYKLAAAEQGANGTTRCRSGGDMGSSVTLPTPECIFNDVTVGDIDVNCGLVACAADSDCQKYQTCSTAGICVDACNTAADCQPGQTCVASSCTPNVNPNCYAYVGSTTAGILSSSTTAPAPVYSAGTGWDYATGLGTVNAYNLVNAWSK